MNFPFEKGKFIVLIYVIAGIRIRINSYTAKVGTTPNPEKMHALVGIAVFIIILSHFKHIASFRWLTSCFEIAKSRCQFLCYSYSHSWSLFNNKKQLDSGCVIGHWY